MRLAILSDIHGNLLALEAVLEDLGSRGVDLTVNLGDSVTGPLWPRETLELLETLSFPTVRGNHDRWLADDPGPGHSPLIHQTRESLSIAQCAALGALPPRLEIAPDVLAVHGTPSSDTEYLLEEKADGRLALATPGTLAHRLGSHDARLVLCGHSHTAHLAIAPGNRLVVNPGSAGCPRYADDVEWFDTEAGSPHARYAVATLRARRWSVDFVALRYDWDMVATRALANGDAAWAAGFLGCST